MEISINKLQQLAKSKNVPLYTKMTKDELLSALSDDKYSLGWRWNYIEPNIVQSERKKVMKLLLSPVRNIIQYNNVKNYLDNHKVYITLTTSPLRLKRLPAVLSTLDFTYVTNIYVVLPYKYGRDKSEYNKKDISLISKFPKVKIIRTEKDYGPITKMLPTIKRVKDKKAIIISIDDDVAYPMGMINELIYQKVMNYKNAVIGTVENLDLHEYLNLKGRWPGKIPRKPYADMIEGWTGVLYTKNLVNDEEIKEMERITRLSKDCLLSDDLVISYVLSKYNVPIIRLDNKYAGFPQSYLYGTGEDALMRGGGTGKVLNVEAFSDEYNLKKYDACLNDIHHK
jgi:hypothetical protein